MDIHLFISCHLCIHAGDVTIMASMTAAVAESKAHFGKDAWGLGVSMGAHLRAYSYMHMCVHVGVRVRVRASGCGDSLA